MSLFVLSRRSAVGIGTRLCKRHTSTYKAAILESFDKPLKIENVKKKKLKPGEAVIKVKCCSVNSPDILLVDGVNPSKHSLPIVPGYELSGVITETKDCVSVGKGDRVVALSKDHLGGFAEECVVHEKDIWNLPSIIPFDHGSCIADAFGTALLGLGYKAKIWEKQKVLATFAPAHGYAALDIAANVYKAKVIAVCMNEDDTSNLRDRGAWSTLAYNEKQLLDIVKELTKSKGVDIIYDTLAGDVLRTCLQCIRHEGHIIIAGFTLKELPQIRLSELLQLPSFSVSAVSLAAYRKFNPAKYRQVVSDVVEMREQGLISPTIFSKFRLDQVNEAFKIIKTRQPIGKVVLEID